MDTNAPYDVYFPPRICFGQGCLKLLSDELGIRKLRSCLVVTDEGLVRAGLVDKALSAIKQPGLKISIFSGVKANPDTEVVKNALESYTEEECDSLVAIGGGSSIDTAKGVGILAANGGEIMDYEGPGKVRNAIPFLAAVPTTYGSGSEATPFTVITDRSRHFKAAMGSPFIIPKMAVIDPDLMLGLPKEIGAAVGFDALCHAVESYVSTFAQPFSRMLALEAVRLIFRNIEAAIEDRDPAATLNMGIASTQAGMAFAQTRLGIVHAMAHPLGGYFDIPHGIANAVLLPSCMEFNSVAAPERFKELAQAMSVSDSHPSPEKAVEMVGVLQKRLGIPSKLAGLGAGKDLIRKMAEDTMVSGNIRANPRQVNIEDVIDLYAGCL